MPPCPFVVGGFPVAGAFDKLMPPGGTNVRTVGSLFGISEPVMAEETMQPLSWQAHPARERRVQAAGALGVIIAFCGLIYTAFGSVGWAVVSMAVLLASLSRFFFPSRFEIDEEGITARYPLRRMRLKWAVLRRFAHDRHGGYLSRRSRPSRFDAFQGMHILFGSRRDEVIAAINRRLARERAA